MQVKTIFSILMIILSLGLLWQFTFPFRDTIVTPLKEEATKLSEGYERFNTQTSLNNLRVKKEGLDFNDTKILDTYVPENLHSGKIVYTLSQTALQNRLNIKNIQYSVVEVDSKKEGVAKKLLVEFQFEGSYEALVSWLSSVERADTLIDIDSVKANKVSNTSETLSFLVKMSLYGLSIE